MMRNLFKRPVEADDELDGAIGCMVATAILTDDYSERDSLYAELQTRSARVRAKREAAEKRLRQETMIIEDCDAALAIIGSMETAADADAAGLDALPVTMKLAAAE